MCDDCDDVPDVEVMCWSREGVDAVKEALKAGQNSASAQLPVHVSQLTPQLSPSAHLPVHVSQLTSSSLPLALGPLQFIGVSNTRQIVGWGWGGDTRTRAISLFS